MNERSPRGLVRLSSFACRQQIDAAVGGSVLNRSEEIRRLIDAGLPMQEAQR